MRAITVCLKMPEAGSAGTWSPAKGDGRAGCRRDGIVGGARAGSWAWSSNRRTTWSVVRSPARKAMADRLIHRRIVLTGISRGVGLAIARRFLPEGAEILGVSRDAARLERAAQELQPLAAGRLTTLVADVGQPGAEENVARAVEERWGALDVLMNNAAVQLDPEGSQGVLDQPPDTLARSLDVNLWGPLRLSRALLPALSRGREPRIVHVSSGAGSFAGMQEPHIASYRLSKWALNGLTLLMARELKGKIAVNAFDPGWVKTDMGGPEAPGSPEESAEGALALVMAPRGDTGKFWKNGQEIPF